MRHFWMMAATAALALAGSLVATDAANAGTQTRTSSFAYDPNTGLLTQEVVEPDHPTDFRLQTDYQYDGYGNKKTVSVSGAGITTARVTTIAYDSQGRFATLSTNPLGQQTSTTFNTLFGGAASVTDINNLTASTSYDSLGRQISVIAPDGSHVDTTYKYCSGVQGGTTACPTSNNITTYVVTSTPYAANNTQLGAISSSYFDERDREVFSETQDPNSQLVRRETRYDANDSYVDRVSKPYYASGGTQRWIVYTYDAIGRVLTETLPDNSQTKYGYYGLTTTVTNSLNQTTTTTKNNQGKPLVVADNLNNVVTYAYDEFENLVTTVDNAGHMITANYDLRGRKTSTSDPDLGTWTYTYDVLGELLTQTNARGQITTNTYDELGRLLTRVEPDLTSAWIYDSQTNGKGKVATTTATTLLPGGGTGTVVSRSFTYDNLSRLTQTATTINDGTSNTYYATTSYDNLGRIGAVQYPSGQSLLYNYTNNTSVLQKITDANPTSPTAYWTLGTTSIAGASDAEGHVLTETLGNSVVTNYGYDPNTSQLTSIQAGTGTSHGVMDATFQYDTLGSLKNRTDNITHVTDAMQYDGLNRLTQVTTTNPSIPYSTVKSTSYDALGNITSKSGVGTYGYDPAHPHAVKSVTPIGTGDLNTTYTYDEDGNMTGGAGRTIAWTSFDMPSSIVKGTKTIGFTYDEGHNRIKQTSSNGTTTYYLGGSERVVTGAGAVSWNDYISNGSGLIALHVTGSTAKTSYFNKDHLGSVSVVTSETGAVLERDSFDAWGKRREVDPMTAGMDDPTLPPDISLVSSLTTRGFTGQEQLDDVELIHYNGRLYDPLLGRFISADPQVQAPLDTQSYNRYSYIENSPLSGVDPSGYSFWKHLKHKFKHALKHAFHALTHNVLQYVGMAVNIGLTVILTPELGPIGASFVGGFAGGLISSKGSLQAAMMGAVTSAASAEAFYAVGQYTGFHDPTVSSAIDNPGSFAAAVVGHAAVGCGMAEVQGGKCSAGALSGAVSTLTAPIAGSIASGTGGMRFAEGLAFSIVSGGVGEVAGGGKFTDGAMTGAFGYLFNDAINAFSHEYDYNTQICDTAQSSCTKKAVFDALLRNAYPGQPDGTVVENGKPYSVLGMTDWGAITAYVDYDNLTETNVTSDTHMLCCGYVAQSVFEQGGSIYIHTYGVGSNSPVPYFSAAMNWFLGYEGFAPARDRIQRIVGAPPPIVPGL